MKEGRSEGVKEGRNEGGKECRHEVASRRVGVGAGFPRPEGRSKTEKGVAELEYELEKSGILNSCSLRLECLTSGISSGKVTVLSH